MPRTTQYCYQVLLGYADPGPCNQQEWPLKMDVYDRYMVGSIWLVTRCPGGLLTILVGGEGFLWGDFLGERGSCRFCEGMGEIDGVWVIVLDAAGKKGRLSW